MTAEEKEFQTIGHSIKTAEISQLFGKPCLKINGKAFVCLFNQEMVFKLNGEMHAEALSLDGAHLFDPSGKNRPMKEWVQLPSDYKDSWKRFAKAAFDYIGKGG